MPGLALARGDGSPADADLAAGDRAYEDDDYKEAEKAYREAGKKAPSDPAPKLGLVRVAMAKAGQGYEYNSGPRSAAAAAAITQLARLVKSDDGYAPAKIELGRVLLVQGKPEAALEVLRPATAMPGGKTAEGFAAMGVALLASGQGDDAVKALARAVQLDPQRASRHTTLGAVLLARGQLADATTAFETAVRLAPDDPKSASDLGAAYLAAGDPKKAVPLLEKAISLDPKRPAFHANLAYARILLGDLDGAIAAARQSVKLDDRFASGHINLGIALARKRQFAEARKEFEKARQIDPTDPRPTANLEELKALESGQKP